MTWALRRNHNHEAVYSGSYKKAGGQGEKKAGKLYYTLMVLKGNLHGNLWQALDDSRP
jgi:hypothetical protein